MNRFQRTRTSQDIKEQVSKKRTPQDSNEQVSKNNNTSRFKGTGFKEQEHLKI
jgi:hypothetical protein